MGWPDYGHDAKFKLPKIFTIQAADLSEFMRKWYGISAQTDDKPFAISDAVNVLRTLRHARESVLEQQRSPPTRSDLVAEAMGLGFQGLQGPLLRSRLHHLCATVQGTILGRHGGFADRVSSAAA
jgi:hypothetical protein